MFKVENVQLVKLKIKAKLSLLRPYLKVLRNVQLLKSVPEHCKNF